MNDIALSKAIIENVIDGIIVIDRHGVILLANSSACNLFGYTTEELCGSNVSKLMPSPDRELHDEYLERYKHTGKRHIIGIGREVMARRKDGTLFPARLAVSESQYNDTRVYAGIIHDLSEEKKAEEIKEQYTARLEAVVEERTGFLKNIVETLEQAKEEVNISLLKEKEVNQLKTRFVSAASHEFRTPLSSIQLSVSLIEHYYDLADRKKIFTHLNKIKSSVNNLTAILNDFLSVERIEAGKVQPENKEFDLNMLCIEVIEASRMQAKPGQEIRYEHLGTSSLVNLDTTLLQHCLFNLLSNAIKYSGENSVIDLKTEITEDRYRIWVKDKGIGIPKEEQAHLFEAFFRAHNANDIQGTGLGLNIVKRYTELMKGRIDFESSETTGTIFILTFPVTKAVKEKQFYPL